MKLFLFLLFIYSLALSFVLPLWLPKFNVLFFTPFLVITATRYKKMTALLLAIAAGLTFDLLFSHIRFGLYTLNFFISTAFLIKQKGLFIDRPYTLPLLTFLFSIFSIALQTFLVNILYLPMAVSFEWFIHDLLLIPIKTALYASVFFGFITYAFKAKVLA